MQNITNNQTITYCAQKIHVNPNEIEAKLLDMFTMSATQIKSAVAVRSDAMTYDAATRLMESIIDNTEQSEELSEIDRLLWLVRCAYLSGFEEATVFFNECSVAAVRELCG